MLVFRRTPQWEAVCNTELSIRLESVDVREGRVLLLVQILVPTSAPRIIVLRNGLIWEQLHELLSHGRIFCTTGYIRGLQEVYAIVIGVDTEDSRLKSDIVLNLGQICVCEIHGVVSPDKDRSSTGDDVVQLRLGEGIVSRFDIIALETSSNLPLEVSSIVVVDAIDVPVDLLLGVGRLQACVSVLVLVEISILSESFES
mmetsp:Transcript_14635/g.22689  ORF Transcript_14635/g.22689 Transcript_14635/m.22689 type:complete len:200 (-) Transcript_14635:362-961(-)